MKKMDLGQTITILANIGVIAGIAMLAVELRQNNEALGTQARLEREGVLRAGISRRLNNLGAVRATAKARMGEALSPEEVILLDDLNVSIFTDLFLVYGQVRDGLVPPEAIPVESWRNGYHTRYPRMAESWSVYRKFWPSDFVDWYEENVIQPGSLE